MDSDIKRQHSFSLDLQSDPNKTIVFFNSLKSANYRILVKFSIFKAIKDKVYFTRHFSSKFARQHVFFLIILLSCASAPHSLNQVEESDGMSKVAPKCRYNWKISGSKSVNIWKKNNFFPNDSMTFVSLWSTFRTMMKPWWYTPKKKAWSKSKKGREGMWMVEKWK